MPKKITRRTFVKSVAGSMLTMFAVGTGGYYYAKEVETRVLDVNRYSITHPKIPLGFDQFKIVQFSDTQLGFHYSLQQLTKIVDRMNK